MIKKGDRVYYIYKDIKNGNILEINKEYEVLSTTNYIDMCGDKNRELLICYNKNNKSSDWFNEKYFISLLEYRKLKIKKLELCSE